MWVDGHRVEESTLIAGQQFRIGATVFECLAPIPVLSPPADAPTTLLKRPDLSHPAGPGQPRAASVHRQNPRRQRTGHTQVTVSEGIATIGRAADSSVVLSGRDVSRRHAQIESTPEGFVITDAGSSYGLWVGATEVKSHLLKSGETFRLGQSVVLECVYADDETPSPDATIYVPRAAAFPRSAAPDAAARQPRRPDGRAREMPGRRAAAAGAGRRVFGGSGGSPGLRRVPAASCGRWAPDETAQPSSVPPSPPALSARASPTMTSVKRS